jgi:serine/threonine protein kinase
VFKLLTQPPDVEGLPSALSALLGRCLARDPADRPSPAALIADSAPFLAEYGAAPPLPDAARAFLDLHRDFAAASLRRTQVPGTARTHRPQRAARDWARAWTRRPRTGSSAGEELEDP